MPSYVDPFGGPPQNPAQTSLRNVTLAANTQLYWPWAQGNSDDLLAKFMRVTASAGSLHFLLPPADQASQGEASIFYNYGSNAFDIQDSTGASIATVAAGAAKFLYLFDNSTAGGSWGVFTFGTGTSGADASTLAGAGLLALAGTLNEAISTTNFSTTGFTISSGSRAIFYNWTGGSDTVTLDTPANLGSQWFIMLRNSGSGTLTLAKTSGTIDGVATKNFQPGDAAFITTDGTNFFTIGFGQSAAFSFDYIAINIAGTGNYTLSGSEQNRISYKFTGALTGDRQIVVPATVQQYWVDNSTTGAHVLTIGTSGQATPPVLAAAARYIMYCNGTIVVNAVTGGVSTPISIANGGTSATTASDALTNLGGTTLGVALFMAANTGAAQTALGLGTMAVQNANAVAITGGTASFTGLVTITYAGEGLAIISSAAGDVAHFVSTDPGATGGPDLWLFRSSVSPAANDVIGSLQLYGNNSFNIPISYGSIVGKILDATSSSEDGQILFEAPIAGTPTALMTLGPGAQLGAPTGGDLGVGWLNAAGGIAINGVSVATNTTPYVRQTVLSGPIDSNGFPNFGGSTGSTTVTASATLIATAANGFSTGADRVGTIVNPSWTGLSTNGTMYLYMDIAANGTCTTGSTTLQPAYKFGGTSSAVSGQFTFQIQQMAGFVGNGSAANQTYRVFIGEVTVAGAVVTAITWYALLGRYTSAFVLNLPNVSTATLFSHNLGTIEIYGSRVLEIECTTIDNGYAVGDRLTNISAYNAGTGQSSPVTIDVTSRISAQYATSGSQPLVVPKTGGAFALLTQNSWKYRMLLFRGW